MNKLFETKSVLTFTLMPFVAIKEKALVLTHQDFQSDLQIYCGTGLSIRRLASRDIATDCSFFAVGDRGEHYLHIGHASGNSHLYWAPFR